LRRSFVRGRLAILLLLPLTFALMPLAAVVVYGDATGPGETLVLESGDAGTWAPESAAWFDAGEFGGRSESLAYRSGDGAGQQTVDCAVVPSG
jgi:hypothetical protein